MRPTGREIKNVGKHDMAFWQAKYFLVPKIWLPLIKKAAGSQPSVAHYLRNLIRDDLKERGLWPPR
ncbi:MAG: hypothetical protein OEZ48_00075 [Candidatus Bathyarchaeota archaeon]|nr:hypothetical protein [Candidatus Bathyarchaeota archaeon]MDH5686252.1 hypothetical protein [Candidatus Bathyarchaeota archaeon]